MFFLQRFPLSQLISIPHRACFHSIRWNSTWLPRPETWKAFLSPPFLIYHHQSTNSRGSHRSAISYSPLCLFLFAQVLSKSHTSSTHTSQRSWPQGLHLLFIFETQQSGWDIRLAVDIHLLNQYFLVKTWNNAGSPVVLDLSLLPTPPMRYSLSSVVSRHLHVEIHLV